MAKKKKFKISENGAKWISTGICIATLVTVIAIVNAVDASNNKGEIITQSSSSEDSLNNSSFVSKVKGCPT